MIEAVVESDRVLLLRAAQGDSRAARDLLDLTGDVLYGFVFARVGGDEEAARDLVQATYLEALRSAGSFRGESSLATWVCAIARHHVARHYEAERRRARLHNRLEPVPLEDVQDDVVDDLVHDVDAMIAALRRIPSEYRQVLVLKYLDGWSAERIAGELGRSSVQVNSLLQRARSALRRELRDGSDG